MKNFYNTNDSLRALLEEYCSENKGSDLERLVRPKNSLFPKDPDVKKKFLVNELSYTIGNRLKNFTDQEKDFYLKTTLEMTDFLLKDYWETFNSNRSSFLKLIFPKSFNFDRNFDYLSKQISFLVTSVFFIVTNHSIEEYSSLNKAQRAHFLFNFSSFLDDEPYKSVLNLYKDTVIENPKTYVYPVLSDGYSNKNLLSEEYSEEWLGVNFSEVPKDLFEDLLVEPFTTARLEVLFMFFKKYSEEKVINILNKFVTEQKDFDYIIFEGLLLEENESLVDLPLSISESLLKPAKINSPQINMSLLLEDIRADLGDLSAY